MSTRIVVLLVVVVALVAGCGKSEPMSTPELEHSILATRDRVDAALTKITQAQSNEELLTRMDEAAAAIDYSADELEHVRAPDEYASDMRDLAASLRQLAADLQATADQIRQPGFDQLLTGATGLSFESWVKVNRALSALRAKGIHVPLLARH